MKTILIDARCMRKNANGISQYSFNLLANLVAKEELYQYIIIVNSQYEGFVEGKNVKVIVSNTKQYRLAEQFILPFLAFKHSADIFYSMQYITPIYMPVPTIMTCHDTLHMDRSFWGGGVIRYLIGLWVYVMSHISIKKAAMIITVSRFSKDSIIKVFGIDEGRVKYAYPGVGNDFFSTGTPLKVLNEKYGLKTPYILSVGNMRPYKNVITGIKAFAKFCKKNEEAHYFCVAGKAREGDKRKLQDVVIQEGLEGKVLFVGALDQCDLPGLYSNSSLFVFPSLAEGFGIPVIEAMACGVPVVCSRVASLPEVGGDCAEYLEDPLDHMELATLMLNTLNDKEKAMKMKACGIKRAKDFQWEKLTLNIIETLKSL